MHNKIEQKMSCNLQRTGQESFLTSTNISNGSTLMLRLTSLQWKRFSKSSIKLISKRIQLLWRIYILIYSKISNKDNLQKEKLYRKHWLIFLNSSLFTSHKEMRMRPGEYCSSKVIKWGGVMLCVWLDWVVPPSSLLFLPVFLWLLLN